MNPEPSYHHRHHLALGRLSSADVKINNIKESLLKDCETLRTTAPATAENSEQLDINNFKLDESLLSLLQSDGEVDEEVNGYYPNEYMYNQSNFTFYETPVDYMNHQYYFQQQMNNFCSVSSKYNQKEMSPIMSLLDETTEDEEDMDNNSVQFDLSESGWLESLEEIL